MTATLRASNALTADTWEIDVHTSWTLIPTADTTTTTIDGGDAVELPVNVPIVIGPGCGEIIIGAADTAILIPLVKA